MRNMGALLVSAILISALPGPASAEDAMCSGRFSSTAGQHSQGAIETRADRPCRMPFVARERTRTASMKVVTQPKNGTASITHSYIPYAPKRGFVGKDLMVVQMSAQNARPALVTLHITVY